MKTLRLWSTVCVQVAVLLTSTSVAGQQGTDRPQRATVTALAPVYIEPRPLKTPLRTLDVDTSLEVLEESGDWSRVRFPDPQFGPRIGFVETRLLDIARPASTQTDVSPDRPSAEPPAASPRPATGNSRGRTAAPERVERSQYNNHFVARSGVVFDAGPLMGIEISQTVRRRPALQGYGAIDWHQDASPEFARGLPVLGRALSSGFKMTIPTFVGTGGIKVIAPAGPVRSYLVGGAGVGRLDLKASADGQDLTDVLVATAGAAAEGLRATKALFEVGGGVAVPAGRSYIDAGFRFRKFIDMGQPFELSGLYLGVGMSF